MAELSYKDKVTLRETVSAMGEPQIGSTLEELARRELELLEKFDGDEELRQATLWNAAAMIAAAERMIMIPRETVIARKDLSKNGSVEDPPGDPRPPTPGRSPSG